MLDGAAGVADGVTAGIAVSRRVCCYHVPGQADAFGLYPAHYAAMNEDEQSPQILEAILKANRFAAQQVRIPVRRT